MSYGPPGPLTRPSSVMLIWATTLRPALVFSVMSISLLVARRVRWCHGHGADRVPAANSSVRERIEVIRCATRTNIAEMVDMIAAEQIAVVRIHGAMSSIARPCGPHEEGDDGAS
jgi:hypothetical protein